MFESVVHGHGSERFPPHHYPFGVYNMCSCSHENVETPVLGSRIEIFFAHRFN